MKKAIFVCVVLILFIVLKTVFGEDQIQTKRNSHHHQNLDAKQKQPIQSDRVQIINEKCWPQRCNLICPIQAPPSPYPVRNPIGSQPFPPGPFMPPNIAPVISNGLNWLNHLWDRELSDWFEDRAKAHPTLERIKLTKRQKQQILKQLELGNSNGKQPYRFRDISPTSCYVHCEQYQVFQQQQPTGVYQGTLPNQPGIQQKPTGIYQGVPSNQPVVIPSQLSPVRPPAPPNINRPASVIPGLPVPPSLAQLIPPILGKPVTPAPAQIASTNPGKPGVWITGKPGSSVSVIPGSSGSGKPVSTGPSQQKPGSSTPSNQEESDSEEEEDEEDDEDEPYHEGEDKPVEVTASPPDKRSHKAKGKHKEKRRGKSHHQKQIN